MRAISGDIEVGLPLMSVSFVYHINVLVFPLSFLVFHYLYVDIIKAQGHY